MITYQPATPHSDAIERPHCPDCGTLMRLFGIESEKPGFELHSFACPHCRRVETRTGKAPERA